MPIFHRNPLGDKTQKHTRPPHYALRLPTLLQGLTIIRTHIMRSHPPLYVKDSQLSENTMSSHRPLCDENS